MANFYRWAHSVRGERTLDEAGTGGATVCHANRMRVESVVGSADLGAAPRFVAFSRRDSRHQESGEGVHPPHTEEIVCDQADEYGDGEIKADLGLGSICAQNGRVEIRRDPSLDVRQG